MRRHHLSCHPRNPQINFWLKLNRPSRGTRFVLLPYPYPPPSPTSFAPTIVLYPIFSYRRVPPIISVYINYLKITHIYAHIEFFVASYVSLRMPTYIHIWREINKQVNIQYNTYIYVCVVGNERSAFVAQVGQIYWE